MMEMMSDKREEKQKMCFFNFLIVLNLIDISKELKRKKMFEEQIFRGKVIESE